MSLQVWLPLNGDLRNQGCSDITVTNNGATVDNNGKIGKCYYFNGSSQYLQLNRSLGDIYSNDFSWCIWLKPMDDTRGIIFSEYASSGSSNVAFELLANRIIRVYWNGSPDWTFGLALEKNVWSHVAITKSTNSIKVYINGEFKKENTGTLSARPSTSCIRLGDDYRGGTGVSYMGYMNDARIYDHCLSAAEVKEISQGLVLHYPLNRRSLKPIGTNLVTGVTKGRQTTLLTDGRVGVVTSGTSADTYFTVNLSESITNGTTYYLSCDVSGVSEGQYWGFPLGAQNNTSMPSKFYNGHNEYIFTANDINWGTNRLFLDDNYRNDYAHPASFYNFVLIKNPTFEEVDGSGFGHNSISNAPITTSEDTGRYEEASYFGAYNTPVLTVDNFSSIAPALTSCTITWWGKYDTTTTLLLTGQSTSFYVAASANNNYYHANIGSPTMYKDGVAGTYKCAADGWHHFALTGVNFSTWTALKLNGYGSGWPLKGYISDFRIYATVLSAADILQLYHTSAKIDNKGCTHAYEFIEHQDNILFPAELSRTKLEFTNGLSRYTQSNCQVTLVEEGYHIYRPPNLTTSANGNTMFGGLKLVNQSTDTVSPYNATRDNIWNLQKGHSYILAFHAEGQSSNPHNYLSFNNNMGWGVGGVSPTPTLIASSGIPADFQGEKDCYYAFTINDDIVKTSNDARAGYDGSSQYLSYRHFTFGWKYSNTGALGTDIYLTNFRLYDITTHVAQFTKQGIANFSQFIEQMEKAQIRKNSELLSSEFIEL